MRLSNWIIYGLLTVVSIVLLTLWYGLGLSVVDGPLDLWLTVGWWALIVGGGIAGGRAEAGRRRRARRGQQ